MPFTEAKFGRRFTSSNTGSVSNLALNAPFNKESYPPLSFVYDYTIRRCPSLQPFLMSQPIFTKYLRNVPPSCINSTQSSSHAMTIIYFSRLGWFHVSVLLLKLIRYCKLRKLIMRKCECNYILSVIYFRWRRKQIQYWQEFQNVDNKFYSLFYDT